MRDLKDLLEPLSQEEMPDRWRDIGGRSPRPLPPTRRGSRIAAIVVAFAVVAAAGVLTWSALRPVDRVGPAGAVSNGAIAYLRQSLAEDAHGHRDPDLRPSDGRGPLADRAGYDRVGT